MIIQTQQTNPKQAGRKTKSQCVSLISLALITMFCGCGTPPLKPGIPDFRARAETQLEDEIQVSAVVLSPEETVGTFAVPLEKKGVQPVWLQIENQGGSTLYLMLLSLDPDYISPSEVAWKFRRYGEDLANNAGSLQAGDGLQYLTDLFLDRHIPVTVRPHTTTAGFVYTNLDPGAKAFAVELFGKEELHSFEFVQSIPGFEADFMSVGFRELYSAEQVRTLNQETLRTYLETLPCCVLGGDRKTPGDPLNLVLVGDGDHVLATLVRRGWDLTETISAGTAWKTATASVFGGAYRTSPVSPLYLFGRPQDFALQKTRGSVNERNHLRLWLAPVTLAGSSVWVGQISRDIGVKLSTKTAVTHKIDPVVDEARLYITLDIIGSQTLEAIGYVRGVGYADRNSPRLNYTKDPYHTDGMRVVLLLGNKRRPISDIIYLPWEEPLSTRRKAENMLPP